MTKGIQREYYAKCKFFLTPQPRGQSFSLVTTMIITFERCFVCEKTPLLSFWMMLMLACFALLAPQMWTWCVGDEHADLVIFTPLYLISDR